MHIISIEGNIGSGKSTLFNKLKTYLQANYAVVFIEEPLSEWVNTTDKNGKSILEKYYADQEKYAFPFQMLAYITKLRKLIETFKENPTAIVITERSLYSDRLIFAKMLYDSGKINDISYTIYLKWFDYFINQINYPNQLLHHMIYINTDPQICYERIKLRNRDGENLIPLEYLQSCDKYHAEMINPNNLFENISPNILVLNGNITRNDTENKWEDEFIDICNYIFNTSNNS